MKSKTKINRLFLIMTCMFSIFLFVTSCIACYYAYTEKKSQILSSMDMAYSRIEQEHKNVVNNFWQVYMPIADSNSSTYALFRNYFDSTEPEDLAPMEKRKLTSALEQMCVRDNRIEWIALYSEIRTINYVKYSGNTFVQELPDTFPYISDMKQKTTQMEVYGAREILTTYGNLCTFAICGGVPSTMGNGKILIGYRLDTYEAISNFQITSIPSMRYYILTNNQILFDSSGKYTLNDLYIPEGIHEGLVTSGNSKLYIKTNHVGDNTSTLVYTALWKDIFLAAHQDTWWIIGITFSFIILSLIVNMSMNHSVSKEVSIIQDGLSFIADNNLDYQLPTDFKQGGLPEIAQNINEMSMKLNENIKKAYYFELKQKDAELAQLQTTFNPHFLYNTLEMLRSKSYANGDTETADLISNFSSIFRSFIGAKIFITLKEELAFNKKYLTLLNARYGERVTIQYDIDSPLLDYGIIRNFFQTLIENYFIHGFDADKSNNLIRFTGKSIDDNNMLLTMEDNGFGMTEENIALLNQQIEEPIRHSKESYGLKNLNQRLKLFYGPDYGLHIMKNEYNGVTVQIKLRKMLVEEYDKKKKLHQL